MSVLEVRNLKKYFGATHAVDDISFSVERGEMFGFLGPNGAGKTTTIRCLMDFLRPTGGAISVFGFDSVKDSVALKSRIGYLSGYVRLYETWTGWDHIRFFKTLGNTADSSKDLIARLDFDPTKKAGQLSSGNKQKLGIILAFMHDPELLILDEPTNGLDPLLQNTVYEMLTERTRNGTTVFFSSHNLPEVERVCSRVGIIRDGKMATVERIEALKDKKVYRIQVRSDQAFDQAELKKLNARQLQSSPGHVTLEVRGEILPVVQMLSRLELRDLTIERAPLEEIFMEYYE
jgi:ABC-2 type transport system ATP-binding protein